MYHHPACLEDSMKKPMSMVVSRDGIGILYTCYKLPGHGRKCPDRDDGYHCMRCKYCKAEMAAADATRLLYGGGHAKTTSQ